ncbi:MAG TPA: hypothetical protein VGH44_06395 [Candidatus Saccharimonadia bacterium]|jgi:hypothetical protein
MFIRLLVIGSLVFVPVVALADATPAPADTPAATDTPAPSSASYLLGPSSLTSGAGSSTNDSGSLQPVGGSPLQSTGSDATGLTAPNGSALQAPASSDQTLQVIMGEADGAPVQVADAAGPSLWGWIGLSLLFGMIVTALSLLGRRYPRLLAPLRTIRLRPHRSK